MSVILGVLAFFGTLFVVYLVLMLLVSFVFLRGRPDAYDQASGLPWLVSLVVAAIVGLNVAGVM